MNFQFVFIFSLFLVFYRYIIDSYRSEPNTLTLISFTTCPNDEKNPIHFNPNITQISRNKYLINGIFTFKEYVEGPIEVSTKRCYFDMSHCETFDLFVIRDVCPVLNLQNQVWSDLWAKTEPKAKCPFNPVPIKITNATLDFGYVAHLPFHGYTWTFLIRYFKTSTKIGNKKKLIFCATSEVNITRAHGKKN